MEQPPFTLQFNRGQHGWPLVQCANHWNDDPTKPSAKLTNALQIDVLFTIFFIFLASFLLESLEFLENAEGRKHHTIFEPVLNQPSFVFGFVQLVDQKLVIHVDEENEAVTLIGVHNLHRTKFIELELRVVPLSPSDLADIGRRIDGSGMLSISAGLVSGRANSWRRWRNVLCLIASHHSELGDKWIALRVPLNIGHRDAHLYFVAYCGVIRHLKLHRKLAVPKMSADIEIRRVESNRAGTVWPFEVAIGCIRVEIHSHGPIQRTVLDQTILRFLGDSEECRKLPAHERNRLGRWPGGGNDIPANPENACQCRITLQQFLQVIAGVLLLGQCLVKTLLLALSIVLP